MLQLTPEQKVKAEARLKDNRALIYKNLLNGVPLWLIMQHCQMSEKDVMGVFDYVSRKIRDYLFRKCKPAIPCENIAIAQRSRLKLLAVLPNLNLDVEPTYRDIHHETVTPDNIDRKFRELRS